jgi:predicted deacylase
MLNGFSMIAKHPTLGISRVTIGTLLLLAAAFVYADEGDFETESGANSSVPVQPIPRAESIDLKEVITELPPAQIESPVIVSPDESSAASSSASSSLTVPQVSGKPETVSDATDAALLSPSDQVASDQAIRPSSSPVIVKNEPETILSKFVLGVEVPPNTATRLVWVPEENHSGFVEQTPVLIVNGENPGKTLCLTAAVHGDELNGIEMIRNVMYNLDASKLTGTVIGVPVVNLMGFRRNSRYLPDRRDLNRYFPGNTRGSSASRIAHSFFSKIIRHCDALVDIHTGSFHRTNLPQLRADLSNEKVAALAQQFGSIAVLNGRGNKGSLRAAAVRFGIPAVTLEAGEPLRVQSEIVDAGVKAVNMLLANNGMYGRQSKWLKAAPVYYKSVWVRANQSGILFSQVALGKNVVPGEVLGTVTDPVTNARSEILSPYKGRILGMALDQVVMSGFAAYHIGIQAPEAALIEDEEMEDEDAIMDTSIGGENSGLSRDILDDE